MHIYYYKDNHLFLKKQMELKDIIRNTTDTQPFNKFEIAVLREIHRTLGGTINAQKENDITVLMNSKIIENLGLDGNILMYFYSLYNENLGKDNTDDDFGNIIKVEVPKMKEYEVKLYQNVNSWREITSSVVANDSDSALDAMFWEYDYGNVVDPELTKYHHDDIQQGDYDDVFDSSAETIRDLNESTKKIKIKITEKQLKRLEEDLRYWRVDDANPNNDKYKLGV